MMDRHYYLKSPPRIHNFCLFFVMLYVLIIDWIVSLWRSYFQIPIICLIFPYLFFDEITPRPFMNFFRYVNFYTVIIMVLECSHRDLNPSHCLERAVCLTGLHYRSLIKNNFNLNLKEMFRLYMNC